jgi:hypothetical protein
MRRARATLRNHPPGVAGAAGALLAALLLFGALTWFGPFLARRQQPVVEAPTPPALFTVSEFAVTAGHRACMDSVAVDPSSRLAEFGLRPATPGPQGGPPVELVVTAPGYRGVGYLPGGYPAGAVKLPLNPPSRPLIASVCFLNRGASTVLLDGTVEPRTIARSATRIDGTPVVGDIALTLLGSGQRSLLDRLGEVFTHASDLTDRLIPVWMIWMLAVLVAFGVPIATVAAFYVALREDETAATS